MAKDETHKKDSSTWAICLWQWLQQRDRQNAEPLHIVGVFIVLALCILPLPFVFFSVGRGAVLCAAASAAAGCFVGFLFGIPLTQQREGSSPSPTLTPGGPAPPGSAARTPSAIKPNTNLEEVSNWLTKIIVGVGLVEWQNLRAAFAELSENVALGFSKASGDPVETCRVLAGSLLLAYAILGFFIGFLGTRLFLAPALALADQNLLNALAVKSITDAPIGHGEGGFKLTGAAHAAAEQIQRVSLESLNTVQEAWAWARAQLEANKPQEAVKGYAKAITLAQCQGGDNARLHVGYAAALQAASGTGKSPTKKVREEFDIALRLLAANPDPSVKRRVYINLTYYYLYATAPEGFQTALKYGQEYVTDKGSVPSTEIFANLAAAYGQAFGWLQEHPDKVPKGFDKADYREAALWAVREAVRTDAIIVPVLRKMLLPASEFPGKDPQDNDLEVFSTDEEFRKAVMLLPPSPLPPAPAPADEPK